MNDEFTEIIVREKMFFDNSELNEFTTVYVLDGQGRCLLVSDGPSWETQYWYDAAGILIREKKQIETTFVDKMYKRDREGRIIFEETHTFNCPTHYRYYHWSRDYRKVDMWGEQRCRLYHRPDGRLKHKIIGWYTPEADEMFYKWDRDGILKSTKRKSPRIGSENPQKGKRESPPQELEEPRRTFYTSKERFIQGLACLPNIHPSLKISP